MVTLGGRISWFLVMVEASLGPWEGIYVNSGPHQDTQCWGPLCARSAVTPHYLPFPSTSSLGREEDTQPHPSDTHTQRVFVPAHGAGAQPTWLSGPWTWAHALPASSLAPSWPESDLSGFLCFPSLCPRPGGRLPELPTVLESVMKSPACRRKGLCLYRWWGSMPGCR